MSYHIQVTATPINKMNTSVTCSFKVPEHLNCTVIELQGLKIRFSDIMDPENASVRTNVSMSGRDFGHVGDMTYQKLSVRQCKAALVHHYKNKVLPEIDHPDKESDNFFYAWMLGALPAKIPEWDVEAWKNAFREE